MNNNGIPYINGNLYSWADLRVLIGGVPLTGITAIKYADEQEIENVYGAGRYPVGRAKGKITCTASITLLIDEVQAIAKNSRTGRLQDIDPFDIQVSYLPDETDKITHHTIHDCQFKKTDIEWGRDDSKGKEVELELICSWIQWS